MSGTGGSNSNGTYQGSQDQFSNTTDLNSIHYVVDRRTADMSTATLVQVMRSPYDADGNNITEGTAGPVGFIDVMPLVNMLDGFGNSTPHGTIYHLSYFRYQGGVGAVIADPQVGDIGKMVVAERDTSQVKRTNKQSNPGSHRMYDKADGTYFGITQQGTPQQYLAFVKNGLNLTDSRNGNSITFSSSGVVISDGNGNSITMSSSGIVMSGQGNSITLNSSGIQIADEAGNDFNLGTHKHGEVMTGGGESGKPVSGS